MKFDEMFLAIKEANKRFYKISKLREKIALTQEKKNFEIRDKNQKILESLENKTEEFLETLNKYEKELLGNIVGTGRRQMKTLHEIYNESKTINKSETRESVAEYYVSTLREEIGENKARLLVYKEECYKKVDLNLPMFWMSSIAALIAIFSIIVTMFTSQVGSSDMRGIPYAVVSVAIIVVFLGIYYKLVIADRKNYLLLSLALEQIEHEISQPKLDTKENVVSLSD